MSSVLAVMSSKLSLVRVMTGFSPRPCLAFSSFRYWTRPDGRVKEEWVEVHVHVMDLYIVTYH